VTAPEAEYVGRADRIEGPGHLVTLWVPDDEAVALASSYDAASSTSPSAADSRLFARPIAAALKAAGVGQAP
jgi:hypothetical protein